MIRGWFEPIHSNKFFKAALIVFFSEAVGAAARAALAVGVGGRDVISGGIIGFLGGGVVLVFEVVDLFTVFVVVYGVEHFWEEI